VARINPELLNRLQRELGLKKAQVYSLIARKAAESFLSRDLAAIALAGEKGISPAKYATPEQLAEIRQAAPSSIAALQTVTPPATKPSPRPSKRKRQVEKTPGRRGTSVFVVHGRNEKLRQSLYRFLRSIGLHPLEWKEAIARTGKTSPYVGEILDVVLRDAVGVVVLLSPDDLAQLKPDFVRPSDPAYERKLTGQARPNVLFEAGMAFGRNLEGTILVQVGDVRPFSDVAGRHVVRLTNTTESRQDLITRLANAGCNVNIKGTDWHTEGDFSLD